MRTLVRLAVARVARDEEVDVARRIGAAAVRAHAVDLELGVDLARCERGCRQTGASATVTEEENRW